MNWELGAPTKTTDGVKCQYVMNDKELIALVFHDYGYQVVATPELLYALMAVDLALDHAQYPLISRLVKEAIAKAGRSEE